MSDVDVFIWIANHLWVCAHDIDYFLLKWFVFSMEMLKTLTRDSASIRDSAATNDKHFLLCDRIYLRYYLFEKTTNSILFENLLTRLNNWTHDRDKSNRCAVITSKSDSKMICVFFPLNLLISLARCVFDLNFPRVFGPVDIYIHCNWRHPSSEWRDLWISKDKTFNVATEKSMGYQNDD